MNTERFPRNAEEFFPVGAFDEVRAINIKDLQALLDCWHERQRGVRVFYHQKGVMIGVPNATLIPDEENK